MGTDVRILAYSKDMSLSIRLGDWDEKFEIFIWLVTQKDNFANSG